AGSPIDPQAETPGAWQEYVRRRTGRPAPGLMTEGQLAEFISFDSGYDPAEPVDRAIMATRNAVFPLNGLMPFPYTPPAAERSESVAAPQGGTRPWGLRCPVALGLGAGAPPGSQATDPRSGQMRTTGSWARSGCRSGSAFLAARAASHSRSPAIAL